MKRFLGLLLYALLLPSIAFAAPTYFNSVTSPADNGTSTATTITLTPPASMTTGDLVIVSLSQRGTATFSVNNTGGQSWSSEARDTGTNIAYQIFWAVYDGTWDADPSFDFSAGTNTNAQMHVFRPSDTGKTWAIDQSQTAAGFSAPSTPFTVTVTGVTTSNASTVTLASWYTADDNTWGSISGTGWSVTGGAQYRNTSGSDMSSTYAHKIQSSAAATGNVSKNQATLGGDAGRSSIIAWYEYDPPTPTPTPVPPTATPTPSAQLSYLPMLGVGKAHVVGGVSYLTPTYVQNDTNSNSTGTVTCNLPSTTTSGNFIAVGILLEDGSSTVSSVTDNKSNSYQASTSISSTWKTNRRIQIYHAYNITGGASHTVTVTASGTVRTYCHAVEYSNVQTSANPLDVVSSGSPGDDPTTGSNTTTQNNDLIFVFVAAEGGYPTEEGGFTGRSDYVFNEYTSTKDKVLTTAGSTSATWTTSGSNTGITQFAAFKAKPS